MLDERRARAPSKLGILFEGNNVARQRGDERSLVSRPGTDNQCRVSTLDRCCLEQTGHDHRFLQIAAVAERQILVDIGDRLEMLGNEEFTLDSGKRGEHARVYDLVGPELALDHVGAGRPEFGHRFKPANQLLFLYRRGGASTTNQTDIRSVTAIVRSAVLQRAGRAAAQPSTLTADAASRALSQQAAGARIDVDGAAGAAGRARTSPSPDLYNRGDRDRAR